MTVVDEYAEALVAGRIPAGKYHRAAAVRHLRDRARERSKDFPFVFDASRGQRIERFFSRLKHYKGEWAGQPIVLQTWQQFIEWSLAGWVHAETGLRRFRMGYVEVPRKNGKTLLGGGNADYFVFFDGEPGAEGYCAATKKDQAKIAFGDAKQLVKSSGLKDRIRIQVANLHRDDLQQKLEPLGADEDSTDGLNVHFVLVDEYHAHKTRGLVDVLETAMGARRQPLMLKITTAGDDPVSPCGEEHDYACKVLDGVLQDEGYFAFIAHADPEDDWLDERTWAKANPGYGVSVKPDDMRALATKAKGMPSAAATFKQKRLNLWVNASAPWLSIDGWRKGQQRWTDCIEVAGMRVPAFLEHEPCYVGLDLASKLDLCALVAIFPPTVGRPRWVALPWVWTPEETIQERARRDRAPYDIWVQQGHLLTSPGTSVDHRKIRPVLVAIRQHFDLERIGYDPWHAGMLIKELKEEDGFTDAQLIEVPQTYAGMSAGALKYEAVVLAGELDAGGNPLMAWCAANAVVQRDGKDNVYPVKKKSRGRIDPVQASVIGVNLAEKLPPAPANPYENRGIEWL